jgi:hypothetical protein
MNFSSRRWATIAALSVLLSCSSAPRVAQASILSGCVTPEDAGVSHLVGWVDVGVMLGMAEPAPPASVKVTAPDGSVVDYRDGAGLMAPTDVLPIWFAPAELAGTYELVINGEERCTIVVNDGSDALTPIADEIELDWVPRSAPVPKR